MWSLLYYQSKNFTLEFVTFFLLHYLCSIYVFLFDACITLGFYPVQQLVFLFNKERFIAFIVRRFNYREKGKYTTCKDVPFGKLKEELFIQLRFNMLSKVIRIWSLEGFKNSNMARENALAETVQRIQCLIIMKSYPLKVKGKNYPSFYLNSVYQWMVDWLLCRFNSRFEKGATARNLDP